MVYLYPMRIQEEALLHWVENFYGYGSWNARMWFVALEESGGDNPVEVAEKFNYFSREHSAPGHPTLCDIRDLYRHVPLRLEGSKAEVYRTRYDYRFNTDGVLNSVWKNLITFTHAYRGEPVPDLMTYQKSFFASPQTGSEALIKLYPLPSSHHAWYYSWLDLPNVDFLASRAAYIQHVFEYRIDCILRQIRVHKPELVLMYGMEQINTLKKSIQESFGDATFKMVKAIKQVIPQHHRAELDGTTLLITTQIPALRHNRIETGFDWKAFGEAARL